MNFSFELFSIGKQDESWWFVVGEIDNFGAIFSIERLEGSKSIWISFLFLNIEIDID